MARVYITHHIPKNGIDLLKRAGHSVVMNKEQSPLNTAALKKVVAEYDAVLSFLNNRLDRKVLEKRGSQLKIIANYAVGYDNIDIHAAQELGIAVSNTPCQEVSDAVAEHTFSLMLALSRRIVEGNTYIHEGNYHGWDPDLLVGADLGEKTLGIIGGGGIGRGVIHRAALGFGMKVLYSDVARNKKLERAYKAQYSSLEHLLKESDIISLHVPLLPSTHHMVSSAQFRLMKKGALLINTARGPVVDENALIVALKSGKLGGYACDVFECEPSVGCSKKNTQELLSRSNVIMTPHIASATVRAREAMARVAAENIIAALKGKRAPQNVIK